MQRCKKGSCLEAVVCLDLSGSLSHIANILMIYLPLCYFSFEMSLAPFPNQPVNHLIQSEKWKKSIFYKSNNFCCQKGNDLLLQGAAQAVTVFIIIQIIAKLFPSKVFISGRSFSLVALKHLVSVTAVN